MNQTLPFPDERPPSYIKLDKEPAFEASKHLALGQPEIIRTLGELGYSDSETNACPTNFGVSSAFRILSNEGLAVMHDICTQMYNNRNVSIGTGVNRLGSYVRGAGYRSQFIKEFCDSPELAEHLSAMAGVSLARHSVPAVACGVNYAPTDIRKAVDTWHVDSVAFDVVMMISDPHMIDGGEFQFVTDATNSVNMAGWDDPGIQAELARHEAWRASARLEKLVEDISLHDDSKTLTKLLDEAIGPLMKFRNRISDIQR